MTTTDRRLGVNSSMAVKVPCVAATTANITLSGEQTIDGVSCVEDDRVLVKDQTDASENGIYDVSTGDWTRALDFNGSNDVVKGTYVYVAGGTTNNNYWQITTANPITIGTTNLTFQATDPDSLLRTNLADTSTGQGASLVGIEDSAGDFTATDVEGALAEVKALVDADLVVHAVLTSSLSVTNNTYTAITGLNLSLAASTRYAIEGYLELDQDATGADIKLAFVTGAGSTGRLHWEIQGDSTYDEKIQASVTSTSGGIALTTDVYNNSVIKFKGWILTNGSVTAQVSFAQFSTVANNTTINAGSWVKARKLA